MSYTLKPVHLSLVLLLALAQLAVRAQEKAQLEGIQFEEKSFPCHRLPTHVLPTHYDIELDIIGDIYPGRQVPGNVEINVEIKAPNNESPRASLMSLVQGGQARESCVSDNFSQNEIVLHVDKENVIIKSIKFIGNSNSEEVGIEKFYRDSEKQLISIVLSEKLEPGTEGLIRIGFFVKMVEDQLGWRGLYKSNYRINSYYVTQFQPTGARLIFPCFDEPQLKATFVLTLRHDEWSTALANTPVASRDTSNYYVTTKFRRTPRMSIHMLAFTVGSYAYVERTNVGKAGTLVRVYTKGDYVDGANAALEIACRSLEYMENYTGIEYPLEKFDIVVVPEHDKDNTESWGLAVIRANVTLLDKETREDLRITIGVNVAHLVVHQWFANLITAKWWNDLWITESLAAQKSFEIIQELYPEYKSEYFVRLATLSSILQADSHLPGLHPLSPPAKDFNSSDSIYAIFDVLEFMKGASFAQLIQNDIGEDKFREVLRSLLNGHKYGNVDIGDYQAAIQLVTGIENYFDKFAAQLYSSSYPVLNVALDQGKLTLTRRKVQARELGLSVQFGDASFENEQVVKRIDNLGDQVEIKPPSWFRWDNSKHWFKLNPKPDISTYFRVHYSDSLIDSKFKPAIVKQYLSPMDRLNVLDDAVGLVMAKEMSPLTFKKIFDCYHNEDHEGVIFGMLIASRVLDSLELADWQQSPISQVFLDVYARFELHVPESKSLLDMRAHTTALNWIVQKNYTQPILDLLIDFDSSMDGLVPEVHLREPIYTAVVQEGSPEQTQLLFEHLQESYSYDEQVRILNALIQTNDVELLTNLKKLLNEKWPMFDLTLRPTKLPTDTRKHYENLVDLRIQKLR